MSDIAMRVEGVGKQYRLGQLQLKNQTIGDVFARTAARVLRRPQNIADPRPNRQKSQDELLWALKDISFEVKKGEALGIIGHNGAGKSTLLKILARITEPTEGYADIYGRIGALLEVGTGFHMELSGRENVFLNGAILGMPRREIMRKFDEIVEFAGVEKFMDTPVKRYSSGMRLRLGFAVAAYLEPEILVIDEVLAVGDAAFQQKCLGKMQDVAQEGRTVLFVSHNLDAIITLTERTVLLEQGRIKEIGQSQAVVMNYLRSLDHTEMTHGSMELRRSDSAQDAELIWMQTANEQGELSSVFREGEPISVTVGVQIHNPLQSFQLGCIVHNVAFRQPLFTVPSPIVTEGLFPGEYKMQFGMNPNYLKRGDYNLTLKAFVNGRRPNAIPGLPLKIVIGEDETSATYYNRWAGGSFSFNYDFTPLEPVDESVALIPK